MTRQLTILDVGHGNSAVLTDTNGTVVIDAGPKNFLIEYLKESGISHLNVVLVSHADQDHIGGLIVLLSSDELTLDRVRLNTDSIKGSKIWDDVVYELNQQDKRGKLDFQPSLAANSKEDYSCGAVQIEVLGPSKYLAAKGPGGIDRSGRKLTSNSISAVIRLICGKTAVAIFTGDLDEVGFKNLVEDGIDLRAKTLIFPHHGGKAGSRNSADFARLLINAVSPENVVFSIGRGVHSTPRPEIVGAVRKAQPNARIVCTQLSEHCAKALPPVSPKYVNSTFAAGREKGACCAGTIKMDLASGQLVGPDAGEHKTYIMENITKPMCV